METIIKFLMENLCFAFFLTAYASFVILAVMLKKEWNLHIIPVVSLFAIPLVPLMISLSYCYIVGIEMVILPWAWVASGGLALILFLIIIIILHNEGCRWRYRKIQFSIASVLCLINLLFPCLILSSLVGETVIGRIFIVVYAIATAVVGCIFVNAVGKKW